MRPKLGEKKVSHAAAKRRKPPRKEAPYIRTKPLHKSQTVIEADEEGYTTFQLTVIVNPELERDLMAYGEGIIVLAPKTLVASIAKRHKDAAQHYQE